MRQMSLIVKARTLTVYEKTIWACFQILFKHCVKFDMFSYLGVLFYFVNLKDGGRVQWESLKMCLQ